MRRILLVKILVLLSFVAPGQDLLVNGGFEEENICTEYTVNCAPEAWVSNGMALNNYFKDPNRSFRGLHCLALQAGHIYRPFDRSFARSRLLCGLRKDNVYRLRFHIKSQHAILDSVGIYFGPIDPLLERKPIHKLSPTVYLGEIQAFKSDSSWQEVTIDYKANGNESYITFAYFGRGDIREKQHLKLESRLHFYLDEVSLLPLDANEVLCADWQETMEEIYAENARHEFLSRQLSYKRSQGPIGLPLRPTRIVKPDTLVMPDILFATGKSLLEQPATVFLDSFCRSLAGKSIDSMRIVGHTDNTGTATINDTLGLGRALAVWQHLGRCSYFFRVPIVTKSEGSRQPVESNDTPEGRRKNRRVELLVYVRE